MWKCFGATMSVAWLVLSTVHQVQSEVMPIDKFDGFFEILRGLGRYVESQRKNRRGSRRDTQEKNIKLSEFISAFPPCPPNAVPESFPGISLMQFGYNFVSDEEAFLVEPMEIIDTFTSSKYKVQFMYRSTCYSLPDAFLTSQSLGLIPRSFASKTMEYISGNSTASFRSQFAIDMKTNLGLTWPEALGAAFSDSYKLDKIASDTKERLVDISEAKYVAYAYTLQVKRSVPSKRIIHIWKKLYAKVVGLEKASDQQFNLFQEYFGRYGTHYTITGNIGGEWKTGFYFDKFELAQKNSTTLGRAGCLSLAISLPYLQQFIKDVPKICRDSFRNVENIQSLMQLTTSTYSSCNGAQEKCPHGPGHDSDPAAAFEVWKKTLSSDFALVESTRKWIIALLDQVIDFEDFDEDSIYHDVIEQFGTSKDYKNKLSEFTHFRELMQENLLRYVNENQYCTKSPEDPFCGNCFQKCPSGFAKSYDPVRKECNCYNPPPDNDDIKPVNPGHNMTHDDCRESLWRCEPNQFCQFQRVPPPFGDEPSLQTKTCVLRDKYRDPKERDKIIFFN